MEFRIRQDKSQRQALNATDKHQARGVHRDPADETDRPNGLLNFRGEGQCVLAHYLAPYNDRRCHLAPDGVSRQ